MLSTDIVLAAQSQLADRNLMTEVLKLILVIQRSTDFSDFYMFFSSVFSKHIFSITHSIAFQIFI